mgnify:CR=1 FL=1
MFSQLIANSSDAQSLSDYICNNTSLIDEFVDSGIENQRQQVRPFEEFVLLGSRTQILDSLDFSISQNRAFIAILFDYAERVNAAAVLLQLYQIIQRHNLDIGSRLKASMLYLYNVPNNQVYIERFDEICSKLQVAIDDEDDDNCRSVATFLNYYSSVIYNTAPHIQFAQELQLKAQSSINRYPFLQENVIIASISLDIQYTDIVYTTIQAKIDELLDQKKRLLISTEKDFIIESDTDYSQILASTPKSFDNIRQIAISQLALLNNKDEIFRSLGRGVAILQQEEQLFSYINSYGMMHKAKLLSAFSKFPFDEIKSNHVEIFDWSCGQGLASMVLYEYLRGKDIDLKTKRIVLIEPSEIALKRASLHVKHFDSEVLIKTVLKDMDSLTINDLYGKKENVKLHLFSNILDVQSFSMQHLIELIIAGFNGVNYFVCVSPYINDVKTARFESFVNRFKDNKTYKNLHTEVAARGEWINNWTKIVTLFRVDLS